MCEIGIALSETLQEKMKLLDETVVQYIEGVFNDSVSLQLNDLCEWVAPHFIAAGVVKDEEDAKEIIRSIAHKMEVNVCESDNEDVRKLDSPVCIHPEPTTKKAPSTWSEEDVDLFRRYGEAAAEQARKEAACVLTLEQVIELTHSPDPKVRKATLRDMCPCHVKDNIEVIWKRIMEMYDDPDPDVRYQVLHDLCDGSPLSREDDVIRTLEAMHSDKDKKVRRRVHQVLTHYRRTGKWNIM